VSGECRLLGGDRLCRKASIPEPPRHLARNDHGLRIQRSEQLATEQALDRRPCGGQADRAVGVAYGPGRRPEKSFQYDAGLGAAVLQCRIDLLGRHRSGRWGSEPTGIGLERLAYRPHEVELIILAPEQGAFAKLSEGCRRSGPRLPEHGRQLCQGCGIGKRGECLGNGSKPGVEIVNGSGNRSRYRRSARELGYAVRNGIEQIGTQVEQGAQLLGRHCTQGLGQGAWPLVLTQRRHHAYPQGDR
jgi:hypothetical protein